jgi:PhnB protein
MSQKVIPYLLYEDVGAAIDWLGEAFGFREELRYAEPDGRISHAEVRVGDASIMLGGPGAGPYRGRGRIRAPCSGKSQRVAAGSGI